MKKICVLFFLFAVLICFCSCGVSNDMDKDKIKNNAVVTEQSTAVYNYFKDRIPEFGFKNEPVEKYDDGLNYILSVECSQKEYKSCIKKLKKAGFNLQSVEADTYYSAVDEEGYFVEVAYVGEMLTLYIDFA